MDTSGFYSLLVTHDDRHDAAAAFLSTAQAERQRFVTTDYVLDETITLLKARGAGALVERFLPSVLDSSACTVEWMSEPRFVQTAELLKGHDDKGWSFTDCLSFLIMRERKLIHALTKDKHFEQAGFIALLRSNR